MSTCNLCGLDVEHLPVSRDAIVYDCRRCGRVDMSGTMSAVLLNNPNLQKFKHLLSGITRYRTENNLEPITILSTNFQELEDYYVPRNIAQKLNLILRYLSKKSRNIGAEVIVNPSLDYPISFSINAQEFSFFLMQLETQGLIHKTGVGYHYYLTIEGWNKIEDLNSKINSKKQAFIAMWFDDNLKDAYLNGFSKAIKDTGFEPMRIDLKEHNKKIDDEIIAEIKDSAFLIADFTGQRGGVYFEAGFAMGLGIPVIWTCNDKDINELHFDTRQYNHITWSNTEELYTKLVNRIKATIK